MEGLDLAPEVSVDALRVLVDPAAAGGVDEVVRFRFADGTICGLHVRNHVAVPLFGGSRVAGAEIELALDLSVWADICSGRRRVGDAIDDGSVQLTGDRERLDRVLACFDHPSFGA